MKVRVAATLVSDNGNHYSIGIEAEKDRHEKGLDGRGDFWA